MVFLIILIIMFIAVNKVFRLNNVFNPYVIFFYYHAVYFFIALTYQDVFSKYAVISEKVEYAIVLSFILSFVGAYISKIVLARIGKPYINHNNILIDYYNDEAYYSKYIVLFMGILLACVFIIQNGLIFFMEDADNMRIEMRKGSGLITLLSINFIIYGYLSVLTRSGNKSRFISLLVLFIISAFCLLSFGNRAPFAKLLLLSLFVVTLISGKKFKTAHLFLGGIIIFLLIVVLGILRMGISSEFFSIYFVATLGWRPFVLLQNLQWIVDAFPQHHDFLFGRGYLIEASIFLPGSNPNFSTWLKDTLSLEFSGGSFIPSYIGFGYVNFGKIAFILYPLFYGFVLNSIYQVFINYNKDRMSPSKIVLLLLVSLNIAGCVTSNILAMLISNIMFIVFARYIDRLIFSVFFNNNNKINS